MSKYDDKHARETKSDSVTVAYPEPSESSVNHFIYAMANELLEKSAQDDWQSVLSLGRKMINMTLGYGYFALAVTLKKLYWSLVPHLNVTQARKYVLRATWSLARAKHENDTRFLIHRDPEQFQLRKQGGTVTHLIRIHNFDPDAVIPPAHELETFSPSAARLMSLVGDENAGKPKTRLTNHHDRIQPPHITLVGVSEAIGS